VSVLVRARPAFLGTPVPHFGLTAWTSGSPVESGNSHVIGHWLRNIHLISIDYAFRPRLRTRLTLGGFTFPRNPWAYGERDFHPLYRYSSLHARLLALHVAFRLRFTAPATLSYHSYRVHGFGVMLIPDNYRRQDPRPVSCYALFK